MTTLLGILLGAAIVVIGLQERRIASLNSLADRLLDANENFGVATKKLVEINDAIAHEAQTAQRLSTRAVEAAKDSNDRAEKAIQLLKELNPQP